MQILPKDPKSIGESLGEGLGSGLQQLANMKLQHVTQRLKQGQNARGLKALFPNMSTEEVADLSNLDSNLLQHLLSPRGLLRQKMANRASEASGEQLNNMPQNQMQLQQPQMQQQNPQQSQFAELLQSLQNTPASMFAQNQLMMPTQQPQPQFQQPMSQQAIQQPKQIRKANRVLTERHIDAFLKKAGNDPKKAKELARLAGYKV